MRSAATIGTGGRLPALIGGDDGVADVQLTEEGDGVAVAVGHLPEPGAPAVPTVAEHHGPRVLTGDEEIGDVVRLDVEPGLVRREARRELESPTRCPLRKVS